MCALRKSNTQEPNNPSSGYLDRTVPLLVSKTLHNGQWTYQPCLKEAPVAEKEDRGAMEQFDFWFSSYACIRA
jgi:hypothetical protein